MSSFLLNSHSISFLLSSDDDPNAGAYEVDSSTLTWPTPVSVG